MAALDAGGVVDHIVEGYRQGAVMTLQHHAEGIADEQHLDAGLTGGLGEGGIVGGQHGDLFATLLEPLKGREADIRHARGPRGTALWLLSGRRGRGLAARKRLL